MAAGLPRGSELSIVVDLAVEDDDDAAVFVVDWLRSSAQIDNAQTAGAEPPSRVEVHAFFIRFPVVEARVYAPQQIAADRFSPAVRIHAADSAHKDDG